QLVDHPCHRLAHALLRRIARDLRSKRLFVRVAHTGEVGDLAGDRLAVKAFDVALDERVQRAAGEDLDEVGRLAAHLIAHVTVGGDRRGDRNSSAPRDQARYVADATDVGVAVLLGEAQSFGEVGTDLVAVEQLGVAPATRELRLERGRDRGFARAGQPREPDDESPGHASPPSSPQRCRTDRSTAPKRLSLTTPMTKITIIKASSCCVSSRFLANCSCVPSEVWLPATTSSSADMRLRHANAQPCLRPPTNA